MANSYTIESILISADSWLFTATTASSISKELTFISPNEHGKVHHIVKASFEAEDIDAAWRHFYATVENFVEAMAFQTTSYVSFHDWNHLIINHTQETALISQFKRSFGTALNLYSQERVDDVHILIKQAKKDSRLKSFLHCYRMALLVDSPETQDAYEKYLILAAESLAGEMPAGDGTDRIKHNSERLKQILGKDLHKYFFSSIHPVAGKTIRNANMHTGKSPNEKPSKAIELVNKMRQFVAANYGLNALTIIEENHSPTRGLYGDDGGRLLCAGNVHDLSLENDLNIKQFIKDMPSDIYIPAGKAGGDLLKNM